LWSEGLGLGAGFGLDWVWFGFGFELEWAVALWGSGALLRWLVAGREGLVCRAWAWSAQRPELPRAGLGCMLALGHGQALSIVQGIVCALCFGQGQGWGWCRGFPGFGGGCCACRRPVGGGVFAVP
jgi:hypothetical protein